MELSNITPATGLGTNDFQPCAVERVRIVFFENDALFRLRVEPVQMLANRVFRRLRKAKFSNRAEFEGNLVDAVYLLFFPPEGKRYENER